MATKNQFPSEADVKRQRTIANCEKVKNDASTAEKVIGAVAVAVSAVKVFADVVANCANNSQK